VKRKDKVIGTSLGARVVLTASGPIARLLDSHRADLAMLFIVSDLDLRVGSFDTADQVRVEIERAPGTKCERCWRIVPAISSDPEWAGLCARCVDALAEPAAR
jgi:isoleucyl-tRNA synthetase